MLWIAREGGQQDAGETKGKKEHAHRMYIVREGAETAYVRDK